MSRIETRDLVGLIEQVPDLNAVILPKIKTGLVGPALKRRVAVRFHRSAAQTGGEFSVSVELRFVLSSPLSPE